MLESLEPLCPRRFAEQVFHPDDFPDARLFQRTLLTCEWLVQRLEQPTARSMRALRRGAERLWNNDRIEVKRLEQRSEDAAAQALRGFEQVTFSHDSTDAQLTPCPEDAGPLRHSWQRGYMVHLCHAVDGQSHAALGLFCASTWRRSWKFRKQEHKKRPSHKKESIKWRRGIRRVEEILRRHDLHVQATHVFDREGDVYENFRFALRGRKRVVVRAAQDRCIAESKDKLRSYLQSQPVRGVHDLKVRTRLIKPTTQAEAKRVQAERLKLGAERSVQLQVRFAPVTLKAPKGRKGSLPLYAVYVCEANAPSLVQPLEWLLLTTIEVRTLDDALHMLQAYRDRWSVEEVIRVTKMGLQLEEERVDNLLAFRRLLAIVAPMASHLVRWTHAARVRPNVFASRFVSAEILQGVWQVCGYRKVARPSTSKGWRLGTLIAAFAQLGGYERRKEGSPGWLVLWRGWREAKSLMEAFAFARTPDFPAPD